MLFQERLARIMAGLDHLSAEQRDLIELGAGLYWEACLDTLADNPPDRPYRARAKALAAKPKTRDMAQAEQADMVRRRNNLRDKPLTVAQRLKRLGLKDSDT